MPAYRMIARYADCVRVRVADPEDLSVWVAQMSGGTGELKLADARGVRVSLVLPDALCWADDGTLSLGSDSVGLNVRSEGEDARGAAERFERRFYEFPFGDTLHLTTYGVSRPYVGVRVPRVLVRDVANWSIVA